MPLCAACRLQWGANDTTLSHQVVMKIKCVRNRLSPSNGTWHAGSTQHRLVAFFTNSLSCLYRMQISCPIWAVGSQLNKQKEEGLFLLWVLGSLGTGIADRRRPSCHI